MTGTGGRASSITHPWMGWGHMGTVGHRHPKYF